MSGFCFNLSSSSRSDVSDSYIHVYRPMVRLVAPVNDPPTSLSLSLPGAESFEASSVPVAVTHPPPVPKPASMAISVAM